MKEVTSCWDTLEGKDMIKACMKMLHMLDTGQALKNGEVVQEELRSERQAGQYVQLLLLSGGDSSGTDY